VNLSHGSLSLSNEQSDISDPFAKVFPHDSSSDPFDWSTGTIDTENPDTLGELENNCITVAISSDIENVARKHSCPTPTRMVQHPRQNPIALESPVLHDGLFGKFEALLNMCKRCTTICLEYY
jgi:hypothetical protein